MCGECFLTAISFGILVIILVSACWESLSGFRQNLRQSSWPTRALGVVILLVVVGFALPSLLDSDATVKEYQSWYGSLVTIIVALFLAWIPLTHRAREIRAKNMLAAADWLNKNNDAMSLAYSDTNMFLRHDKVTVNWHAYAYFPSIDILPDTAKVYIPADIRTALVSYRDKLLSSFDTVPLVWQDETLKWANRVRTDTRSRAEELSKMAANLQNS